MHRCWKRATFARAFDRTRPRRYGVGGCRLRQAGSVQEDTTLPIEEIGSREGWICGVDRDCPAFCMAQDPRWAYTKG